VEAAGGRAAPIQADVSKDAQVRAMVSQTVERFGRIDVLVNNAGITHRAAFDNLDALDGEVWDRLYSTNVKGAFFCSRAVTETMRRQGEGRIIYIASVAGLRPGGSSIAYCASKAAMIQVAQCLAKTLGPEIRVNTIAPGMIDETRWNSDLSASQLDAMRSSTAQGTPLKRVGLAADVAEAALYLACGADYMTGSVLVVDGGRQLTS
jgi:NAD(P)-dependent dehydrogenase (short-subunit alcohol dehydrogenase family)